MAAPPLRPSNSNSQGPRRRLSYLIPPPPSHQPAPFLTLPGPSIPRRGNPNPLIILADSDSSHDNNRSSSSLGNGQDHGTALSISAGGRTGSSASSNGAASSSLSSSVTSSRSGSQGQPVSLSHPNSPWTQQRHPEHTLGITALALDTSTVIDAPSSSSKSSQKRPAGILYSGGKDGLVASWELGLPFKRRDVPVKANGNSIKSRYRPRWSEDTYDSEEESESSGEDGDDGSADLSSSDEEEHLRHARGQSMQQPALNELGLRMSSSPPNISGARGANGLSARYPKAGELRLRVDKTSKGNHHLPYEQRWQIDQSQIDDKSSSRPAFRQAHRGHTDWINDILLCNLNQTVISASSDRMIRAWNPHDPDRSMLPASIGSHSDYVKCLAHSKQAGWVASGGFDKKIKLWDVLETRESPIVEYGIDASVYAIATNSNGGSIVSGSPEKVVKVYDPRSARSVARLVGHADNVRALLLSADGRHVLSASSDATVKLWSVSMQRCLHTFTCHSDSVWALFSTHPHLETFYSGDRAGAVCKTDFTDCGDIASEGECVILLRNRDEVHPGTPNSNDGITRIVALDDTFVWTGSGSSNICRWRDVPARLKRMAVTTPRRRSFVPDTFPARSPVVTTSLSPNSPAGATPIGDAQGTVPKASPVHTVSFAAQPMPGQRSSTNYSSPLSSGVPRPSSLRNSVRQPSSNSVNFGQSALSSSPANPLTPVASSPHSIKDAFLPASPRLAPEAPPGLPTLNQIPLESLVPLFTPDDPYGRTSGLTFRRDGTGGVGYSASVLSLHRTSSRPMPSTATSPFGPVFSSMTPPSSTTPAPRQLFGIGRNQSPLPSGHSLGTHKPGSIAEAAEYDEEITPLFERPGQQPSEEFLLAQQEFEDRETALDGVPLRSAPDVVIRGRHGLVRSELLNDRRTVISLDTFGEVAVWDIVLGGCIGRFRATDLKQRASAEDRTGSPAAVYEEEGRQKQDILEFVKNRIEGQAVVSPWCSVETKTGLLTVHIEQSRAFDAEVYLDEAGIQPRPEYKVDQRLNLGKWVLRNILEGFIREESKKQARGQKANIIHTIKTASSSDDHISLGDRQQRRPSHISLPDMPDIDGGEAGTGQSWATRFGTGTGTGAYSIALATPAMTPAVLPDVSDLAAQAPSQRLLPSSSLPSSSTLATLPTIPQSPSTGNAVPVTPSSFSQHRDADYFSRPKGSSTAETPSGTQTPKPALAPLTPGNSSPLIGKSTSKMSRFKNFGKKESKKDSAASSDNGPSPVLQEKVPLPPVDHELDHLTPAQRAQHQLLEGIFAHPLQPSTWSETPHIRFVSDLSVMIGEESADTGAWAIVYRGLVSRVGWDTPLLEMHLPDWLLEFALHNVVHLKEPVKIAFILEPWGGAEQAGLPALPSGNARLSATRMLRMRKACHYVAERLELESWKQRQRFQSAGAQTGPGSPNGLQRTQTRTSLSSSLSSGLPGGHAHDGDEPTLLPEDEVEILCNDQVVPLNMTLAACARYCYGKSGDVALTYRRRRDGACQ